MLIIITILYEGKERTNVARVYITTGLRCSGQSSNARDSERDSHTFMMNLNFIDKSLGHLKESS